MSSLDAGWLALLFLGITAAVALVLALGAVGLAFASVALPKDRRKHCIRMVELLLAPLRRVATPMPRGRVR